LSRPVDGRLPQPRGSGRTGYSAAQAAALATQYKLSPADHFPSPDEGRDQRFSDQAARHVGPRQGAQLSARLSGLRVRSVHAVSGAGRRLHRGTAEGLRQSPGGRHRSVGTFYNKYFPSHNIAMPQPLFPGQVTFDDGSPQTVEQYSRTSPPF